MARISRAGLQVIAKDDIRAVVRAASTDLAGARKRHTYLSAEEANDLLDLLKEVRIAATWEDDE